MDVSDVVFLDGHVVALDKWMGCLLCPDPACVQDKVNLLDKVVKVPFYKRKKGEDASYSRQASFGTNVRREKTQAIQGKHRLVFVCQ
jgi:hypothetical protein